MDLTPDAPDEAISILASTYQTTENLPPSNLSRSPGGPASAGVIPARSEFSLTPPRSLAYSGRASLARVAHDRPGPRYRMLPLILFPQFFNNCCMQSTTIFMTRVERSCQLIEIGCPGKSTLICHSVALRLRKCHHHRISHLSSDVFLNSRKLTSLTMPLIRNFFFLS